MSGFPKTVGVTVISDFGGFTIGREICVQENLGNRPGAAGSLSAAPPPPPAFFSAGAGLYGEMAVRSVFTSGLYAFVTGGTSQLGSSNGKSTIRAIAKPWTMI